VKPARRITLFLEDGRIKIDPKTYIPDFITRIVGGNPRSQIGQLAPGTTS
jgi:hypothetical protein